MAVHPDRMASPTLATVKKEFRNVMRHRLSVIPGDSIQMQTGNAVFEALSKFKPYQDANRIGIYLSMPTGELQTDAIVNHALDTGKQVFVPYLYKPKTTPDGTPASVMDMVKLHGPSDLGSLARDKWGIPTISSDSLEGRERILGDPITKASEQAGKLDMILMPGVAFSIDDNTSYVRRLGHGKGFYDYFLHRYFQNHKGQSSPLPAEDSNGVTLYGLSLDEQWLQSGRDSGVPVGPLDFLLHGLVLGNGEIKRSQR